jgi:predicted nucleic acid-binding protein
MDTDAIVASMRSRGGASARLLAAARGRHLTLLATAALFVEYEAVCGRAEHRAAAGFDEGDLKVFLDALVDLVEPVQRWFAWRPQLPDPDDELVLDAALNGRAEAVATFNRRDFASAAGRFGVEVLLPAEALRRVS